MPFFFDICENGHVLYVKISDPWTMADYEATISTDIAHRNAVPFRVHYLLNVVGTNTMPNGVIRARQAGTFTHPRAGNLAIVGTSPLIRIFSESVMRLAHFQRAKFFEHENDAWSYLHEFIQAERVDIKTHL